MAWIPISERDPRRIEVLIDVRAGRRTVAAAAAVLAVSDRQAYRLLAEDELYVGSGLIKRIYTAIVPGTRRDSQSGVNTPFRCKGGVSKLASQGCRRYISSEHDEELACFKVYV